MRINIYRKVSLDRLSSPDQLDLLMKVTHPRSWMVLTGLIAILATAVLWGVFGSIPVKIQAQGILLTSGGVQTIVHAYSGQVTDIRAEKDQFVQKGDVIARINQPGLVDQIQEAERELAMLESNAETEAGLIDKLQELIQYLRTELDLASRVVSPYAGRILEIKASPGDVVQPGMPIVMLERADRAADDLKAVLYVSVADGGEVEPGMEVFLSPSSVKKEEYGLLLGKIESVAKFPSSLEGMVQTLGNADLAQMLAGGMVPIEVKVSLSADAKTASGYKWSTGEGPPVKISSGTLSAGTITISEIRPISMLIP